MTSKRELRERIEALELQYKGQVALFDAGQERISQDVVKIQKLNQDLDAITRELTNTKGLIASQADRDVANDWHGLQRECKEAFDYLKAYLGADAANPMTARSVMVFCVMLVKTWRESMSKSDAVASFVTWLNREAATNLDAVREKMPRPERLRPTQHVPNNDAIEFALKVASAAVKHPEIMNDIDRLTKGAVALPKPDLKPAVMPDPKPSKRDAKRTAKAKNKGILKKAAAMAKADKSKPVKKAAKKAPVKKAAAPVKKKAVKKAAK